MENLSKVNCKLNSRVIYTEKMYVEYAIYRVRWCDADMLILCTTERFEKYELGFITLHECVNFIYPDTEKGLMEICIRLGQMDVYTESYQ